MDFGWKCHQERLEAVRGYACPDFSAYFNARAHATAGRHDIFTDTRSNNSSVVNRVWRMHS
jgi:hypothetical protein